MTTPAAALPSGPGTAPAPLRETITDRGWALYRLARADRHGAARLEATEDLGDALEHGTPAAISKCTTELAFQWSVTLSPGGQA